MQSIALTTTRRHLPRWSWRSRAFGSSTWSPTADVEAEAAASASAAAGASGPLKGYVVLDLGQVVAGNMCAALLGYFGASVIKVEPPQKGDPLRHLRDLDPTGTSLWWRTYGRNRQCMTADLRTDAGRDIIRRMAQSGSVDVILENFRPGVMESWGLGPDDLPDHIVFSRISGYGQTGPKSSLPGYASVCEAASGFRSVNGYPDRPSVRPNISLGDSLAGLHAAFGVVMSLLERQKSGRGQVIDTALTESMFNMLEGVLPEYIASGKTKVRSMSGSSISQVVPSGVWRSKDNHYVVRIDCLDRSLSLLSLRSLLSLLSHYPHSRCTVRAPLVRQVIGANGNSVYDRLVTLMNRPDMKSDSAPRFASDATRVDAEGEINAVIEEYVSSLDAEEVIKNLEDARVPAGMIMTIEDVRTMDGSIDSRERSSILPRSRTFDSPTTPSPALTRSLSSVHSSDTDLRR